MMLFICTGNTCRSPMAEHLYKSISGKEACSAGMSADFDAPAAENAVKVMKKRGIDLSGHKSKRIDEDMLNKCEAAITMTEAQEFMLKYMVPEYSGKIITLAKWAGKTGDIIDPYGGDEAVYDRCAKEIEEYINAGIKIHR